ncbi:hypothetical protein [Arsenicibacter rosenii]|uniref:Uncharacterized protein n=1 Tax=Arsenicibacter rosenii TaxID=1750698 RepID=A0A1S2VLI7_9BACT|nr:hypothetical protein [Arsenicibacter rosenii]OIN59095.1 hypothetical protein BLX24_12890 [Arsenicibacter rosenii]
MKKSTLRISHKDIPNHYSEDEDGKVTQNDPTVQLVLIDDPSIYQPNEILQEDNQFSMTVKEMNYYNNSDNFYDKDYKKFDNEDYEDEDYTPYNRWSSYKIIHQYVRIRWFEQEHFMLQTYAYIKKRIRLLASPINDTLAFLRSEHNRLLPLFDELGPMADLVFHKTHSKSADFILNKVWYKQVPDELPFGDHWTPEELRRTPQSHWSDDDVWSWDEFWAKATPILINYHKAKTYLIMIRFLQRLIWLCEENKVLGYKAIMKKAANMYHQDAIDNYSSLQPPSYPNIQSLERHVPIYHKGPHVKDSSSKDEKGLDKTRADSVFNSLEEIFSDKKYINLGIDILLKNNGDRILIDANGKWLKKKGDVSILAAWLDEMEYKGMIKKGIDRKIIRPLLQNFFPDLELGTETRQFSEPASQTYQRYRGIFRLLIAQNLH